MFHLDPTWVCITIWGIFFIGLCITHPLIAFSLDGIALAALLLMDKCDDYRRNHQN